MSDQLKRSGRAAQPGERLVIVRVKETIEPRLTARAGADYQSPPQGREQSMTLVRLLLGCDPPAEKSRWTAPIAGGRRVVSLSDEPAR